MVIGNRQRHRDLTIVLLAELAAILPCHANRVLSLLRKTGVVNDPCFNRTLMLNRRQHHLARLGQNLFVRPRRVAHEMQQRLMLSRCPSRRRHRRHRLDALALARHHQAEAIISQRAGTVRVTNHAHKPLDVSRKPRFTVANDSEIHISLHLLMPESLRLSESDQVSGPVRRWSYWP